MAKKTEQGGTTSKSGSDYKALKREFARRLQSLMLKKGWNQSEMARQAALHMPDGKFGRDNISKYLMMGQSGTLPSPLQLTALAKALRVPADQLMPTDKGRMLVDPMAEGLALNQIDDETMHIRLNQRVPREVALKIVGLLQGR